jgi:hypothetical protein
MNLPILHLSLLGYIDPGSGMMLFQLVLAGCLSVLAYFRKSILRVLGIFKGSGSSTKSDPFAAPSGIPATELPPGNIVPFPEQPTESEADAARAA